MSKLSKRFGMEINVQTGEISKVQLPDLIEENPINEEIISNDPETV